MCQEVFVASARYSGQIFMKLEFYGQIFSENVGKFHEISWNSAPVGAGLFHADGRKDRQACRMLIVAFSNFTTAPDSNRFRPPVSTSESFSRIREVIPHRVTSCHISSKISLSVPVFNGACLSSSRLSLYHFAFRLTQEKTTWLTVIQEVTSNIVRREAM